MNRFMRKIVVAVMLFYVMWTLPAQAELKQAYLQVLGVYTGVQSSADENFMPVLGYIERIVINVGSDTYTQAVDISTADGTHIYSGTNAADVTLHHPMVASTDRTGTDLSYVNIGSVTGIAETAVWVAWTNIVDSTVLITNFIAGDTASNVYYVLTNLSFDVTNVVQDINAAYPASLSFTNYFYEPMGCAGLVVNTWAANLADCDVEVFVTYSDQK